MLQDETVLCLTKYILKRYEHNLDGGTLFLYDVKTKQTWKGNNSSEALVSLVDGKKKLHEIYAILQPSFIDYDYKDFKNSFDSLIVNLINNKFLEIIH